MGSTDSIPQNNPHRLNLDNWRYNNEDDQQDVPFQYGKFVRLKNNMTGEELNEYELYLRDKDDYSNFMQIYQFRNSIPHLVPINYLNQQNIKEMCSLIFHLKIYIEDFPLRLCNIKEIPFPQNLYVLDCCLKGFRMLFNQIGHFHITQDLICINEQGYIKVWLNQNLSKFYSNNVSQPYQMASRIMMKQASTNENSMIWELITIVDQLTNRETVPGQTFIQFLGSERISQLDFHKAIKLVTIYAEQNDCEIPEFFESVIKVIREKKGIYDSEIDFNVNARKSDEINVAAIGNRFKQSHVQRVNSFKNNSVRSYAGSQSYTYADRLKKLDNSNRNKLSGFGLESQIKESPFKTMTAIMRLDQNKQVATQRVLTKNLSSSSFSSPQIQSLTAISHKPNNLFGQRQLYGNSSNSQIISKRENLSPLNESESPERITPPTYFSHILQPMQHQKIRKKATLLSFGQEQQHRAFIQSRANSQILNQIPVIKSLCNSKVQAIKIPTHEQAPSPPNIIYSFNPALQNAFPNNLDQSQQMPISPPSINKSSTIHGQNSKVPNKKQDIGTFSSQLQQIPQKMRMENFNMRNFSYDNKLIQSKHRSQAQNSDKMIKFQGSVSDIVKNRSQFSPKTNPRNKKKGSEQTQQHARSNNLTHKYSKTSIHQHFNEKSSSNPEKQLRQTRQRQVVQQGWQRKPKGPRQHNMADILLNNEYNIDPDIVVDLIKYETKQTKAKQRQKRKQEQKSQKYSIKKKINNLI